MRRKDDYSVFLEKFKPDLNLDGTLKRYWDMRQPEDLNKLQNIPPKNIWTMIEGGSGKWYICTGWHIVNREFYIITSIPWDDKTRDYLYV